MNSLHLLCLDWWANFFNTGSKQSLSPCIFKTLHLSDLTWPMKWVGWSLNVGPKDHWDTWTQSEPLPKSLDDATFHAHTSCCATELVHTKWEGNPSQNRRQHFEPSSSSSFCSKNDLLLLCLATPASRPRPWLTFCHGCIWAHRGCHFWFFLLINVTMYTNNFCCHCLGQINVFICSIRCTHPPWANLWISPQLCFIIIFSVLIWQRLFQCTIDINKVDGSGVVRGTLTGHGRLCDEARILDEVFDPKFSWDEASCERLSMDNPSKLPSRHLIHWKFKKGTKVGCHLHK